MDPYSSFYIIPDNSPHNSEDSESEEEADPVVARLLGV